MIADFFTKTVTVYRQQWQEDESFGDYQAESEVATFLGHVQQARNPELVQELGLSYSKAFMLWCPLDSDIKDGDRVEIDSISYTVRATGEHAVGSNTHLSLVIERH